MSPPTGTGPSDEAAVLVGCCTRAWAYGLADRRVGNRWIAALVAEQMAPAAVLEASLIRLALRPHPVADPALEASLIMRLVEAVTADGGTPPPEGMLGRLGSTLRAGLSYADWVADRLRAARTTVEVLARPTRNPLAPLPVVVLGDHCLRRFGIPGGLLIAPEPVGLLLVADPATDLAPVAGLPTEVVETAAVLAVDRSGPLGSLPDALHAAALLTG